MTHTIYCLHGDDPCLVDEAMTEIEHLAKKSGFQEREMFMVDPGFDWMNFSHTLFHPSLFAKKRFIQLKFLSTKLPDIAAQLIQRFVEKTIDDLILLFVFPKLDARAQKNNWFKAIQKKGKIIPVYPLSGQRQSTWIKQHAARFDLQLTPEAIELLFQYTENNLLAAKQHITHLSFLFQHTTIDIKHLLEILTEQSQYTVFALIDAIQQKKMPHIAQILRRLEISRTEPTLVLWALLRIIREKKNFQAKCMAAKIDKMIKGFEEGDPWQAFYTLSMRLGAREYVR